MHPLPRDLERLIEAIETRRDSQILDALRHVPMPEHFSRMPCWVELPRWVRPGDPADEIHDTWLRRARAFRIAGAAGDSTLHLEPPPATVAGLFVDDPATYPMHMEADTESAFEQWSGWGKQVYEAVTWLMTLYEAIAFRTPDSIYGRCDLDAWLIAINRDRALKRLAADCQRARDLIRWEPSELQREILSALVRIQPATADKLQAELNRSRSVLYRGPSGDNRGLSELRERGMVKNGRGRAWKGYRLTPEGLQILRAIRFPN